MISALEAWSKTQENLKSKNTQWINKTYELINEAAEDGKFSVSIEHEFPERLVNLFTNLGYEVKVVSNYYHTEAYTIINWSNPEHNNV